MNEATAPERIDNGGMASESFVSLADVANEVGGAWPEGWYRAEIIEGYQAKSFMFATEDSPARAGGASRNLRVALRVTNGADDRTTFTTINYNLNDLKPEGVAAIKAAREEFKSLKRWPNTDLQHRSIALGELGQLEKALGFGFKIHPLGHIVIIPMVGQRLDVRLGIDEKGYNEVTAFAKAGTKAK